MSSPPKHNKKKSKDKGKAKATIDAEPRNEGTDNSWPYKPPEGMVVLDTTHIDDQFDWDSFRNNETKELWIVRVPEGFKMGLLDGLQIRQPCEAPGTKLSTLHRKRADYDVWAIDPSTSQHEDDKHPPPRGEELTTLSCLLPRKKKGGKLYMSPKPISQHVIVTHAPATPHLVAEAAPVPSTRYRIPKHLLTHRFAPYGAASSDDNVVRQMNMDLKQNKVGAKGESVHRNAATPSSPPKKKPPSTPGSPTKSLKKRKSSLEESGTPRRYKKTKV